MEDSKLFALEKNILKKKNRRNKGEKAKLIRKGKFSTHLYLEQYCTKKELSGPCLVAAVESV